jgi:hypothetical protein
MWLIMIDSVILEGGLYVYNNYNIVEKHFSFSFALWEAGAGR